MLFQLTWHPARKCWKKYAGGKTYYLGKQKCKEKYDMAGYHAALDEWKQIASDLEAQARAEELFERDPVILEKLALAAQNRAHWEKEYPGKTYEEVKEIVAALELHRRVAVELPREKTVQAHVEAFIAFKTSQVKADQKSPGRLRNIRTYLNRFATFAGKEGVIESITAVTLADYHSRLLSEVSANTLGDRSARDAMQIARQFVRRVASLNVIQLPNNIDSKDLEISVAPKSITLWDFDALKAVLKSAPEPLRLYLLLMANCGMTQKDVSDLLPREVDWEKGIIKRKRSKTGKSEGVPMVAYPLWSTTFELLKKHGAREGVRVFSAPDGSPLVVDDLTSDDKGNKQDKVKKMWDEWIAKVKLKSVWPLHNIRSTSSSQLDHHNTYGRYAQYFLAQSAKTVAEKHYVVPSQKQFDKAVAWLGKQYGF